MENHGSGVDERDVEYQCHNAPDRVETSAKRLEKNVEAIELEKLEDS